VILLFAVVLVVSCGLMIGRKARRHHHRSGGPDRAVGQRRPDPAWRLDSERARRGNGPQGSLARRRRHDSWRCHPRG
jgi:hypothetical protein